MQIINKSNTNYIINQNTAYKIENKATDTFNLMVKAGKLVAKNIISKYSKCNTLVLCGIGGNGGDGFIAAQELKNKGWNVKVIIIGDKNKLKQDSLKAFNKLKLKVETFKNIDLNKIGLFVDAIYGIGLSRIIIEKEINILKNIDNHPAPIVAIDIPSGIKCDTGEILGFAPVCDLTITFSALKIGHILLPGIKYSKQVKVIDIGVSIYLSKQIKPHMFVNDKNQWLDDIIWPKYSDHKYSRGYSLIIGGPKNMTGAARLAAKSAQRAGSGIVCLVSDIGAENIYFHSLTSQLVKSYKNIKEFNSIISESRINSIVIGPGLNEDKQSVIKVKSVLKTKKPAVLDAGAISCFKGKLASLINLVSDKDVIITPHEGELKTILPNLKGTCISKAKSAAKILNSIIVLKGPSTVIASPNNQIIINPAGSKWLATAGSGDVLAGIIGGLLSNKMNLIAAAAYGVWLHSETGKFIGAGLVAEDIPKNIPIIFKKLLKEQSRT